MFTGPASARLRSTALRVTTAAEAAARDRGAVCAGTDAFDLMLRAGSAAAEVILRDHADRLAHGVAIFAGAGNNGGDAYVVAAQLVRMGVSVRVHDGPPPRTADAQRAAALAAPMLVHGAPTGRERLVVDGLLGTGHHGALRESVAAGCARIALARDGGAVVVALDLPSGLDATNGEIADGSVAAHLTVCFGTIKRGLVLQRAHAGRIVVVDIGLEAFADRPGAVDDDAWGWADAPRLHRMIPPIAWNAHKGDRGRLGLAGGANGMAGAIVLACRAALASGAGLVHAIVDEPSVAPVQMLVPQALAHVWSASPGLSEPPDAPRYDALVIGPGLGRERGSTLLLQQLLERHRGLPLVLDADALWHAADAANAQGTAPALTLRRWTRDAAAVVCTPHPGEFARLLGRSLPAQWEERAALLRDFAVRAHCTMLLKGAPTLVATPDAQPLWCVPHGTPLLATGGSGDCLSGIIGTLLAQGMSARDAAVLGASVHGLAAERASAAVHPRGGTLEHVLEALPAAWQQLASPPGRAPHIVAVLAAVS